MCINSCADMLRDENESRYTAVGFRGRFFFFCERSIVANLWCEVVVHGALAKIICDLK